MTIQDLRAHLIDWHGVGNPDALLSSTSQAGPTLHMSSVELTNVVTGMFDTMNRNMQAGIERGLGNVFQATTLMTTMIGNATQTNMVVEKKKKNILPNNVLHGTTREAIISYPPRIVDSTVVVISDDEDSNVKCAIQSPLGKKT